MPDGSPIVSDAAEQSGQGVHLSVTIAPLPAVADSSPLPATGGIIPVELALIGAALAVAGLALWRRARRRGASGRSASEGV